MNTIATVRRSLSSRTSVASFGFTRRPQARAPRANTLPVDIWTIKKRDVTSYRLRVVGPPVHLPLPPPSRLPLVVQRMAGRRAALVVRAAQVSSNDFKNGMTIEMDGAPYKVVGALQARDGRHLQLAIARPQATAGPNRIRNVTMQPAVHAACRLALHPLSLLYRPLPPLQSSCT